MEFSFQPNPQQEQLLAAESKAILGLAGPGTGKTTVFVERTCSEICRSVESERGVCALTFTNAAKQEIRDRLGKTPYSPGFPHYLGTIDSFLLQHIVQPFAAAAKIVPPTGVRLLPGNQASGLHQPKTKYSNDPGAKAPIYAFTFHRGTLTEPHFRVGRPRRRAEEVTNSNLCSRILKVKKTVWKEHGLLTHSDCAYVAALLLSAPPSNKRIAAVLGARFDVLLIDEAQDVASFRLSALLSLAQEAEMRIFIVGDPDQSIFQFSGADPDRLIELEDEARFDVYPLKETYRFNSDICDAVEVFARSGRRLTPSPDIEYPSTAELVLHNWSRRNAGPFEDLIKWISDKEIEDASIAVLADRHNVLACVRYGRDIGFGRDRTPFKYRGIEQFAEAINLMQEGDYRRGFHLLESLVSYYVLNKPNVSDADLRTCGLTPTDWQQRIWNVFLRLKNAHDYTTWDDWHKELRRQLSKLRTLLGDLASQKSLGNQLARQTKKGRRKDEPFDLGLKESLPVSRWPTHTEFLTVHEAKGREFDIVGYVAPIRRSGRSGPATIWSNDKYAERQCVAYVACTRAKHRLGLFVHEKSADHLREKLPNLFSNFQVVRSAGDNLAAPQDNCSN